MRIVAVEGPPARVSAGADERTTRRRSMAVDESVTRGRRWQRGGGFNSREGGEDGLLPGLVVLFANAVWTRHQQARLAPTVPEHVKVAPPERLTSRRCAGRTSRCATRSAGDGAAAPHAARRRSHAPVLAAVCRLATRHSSVTARSRGRRASSPHAHGLACRRRHRRPPSSAAPTAAATPIVEGAVRRRACHRADRRPPAASVRVRPSLGGGGGRRWRPRCCAQLRLTPPRHSSSARRRPPAGLSLALLSETVRTGAVSREQCACLPACLPASLAMPACRAIR
jgi:hypothetical protein